MTQVREPDEGEAAMTFRDLLAEIGRALQNGVDLDTRVVVRVQTEPATYMKGQGVRAGYQVAPLRAAWCGGKRRPLGHTPFIIEARHRGFNEGNAAAFAKWKDDPARPPF
jgi:hypothetical protein